MIRLGLCCQFRDQPIRFHRVTARTLLSRPPAEQRAILGTVCEQNAASLLAALQWCRDHEIGGFRINSQILPLKTHPDVGYNVRDLPRGGGLVRRFKSIGAYARRHGMRLTFHPDQFIVLNAPDPEVVRRSVDELIYQAEVAAWVGADVINIHGGGGYGDKPAALERLAKTIRGLPPAVRCRLTLENDDRIFSPADLLPVCLSEGIPLVYDVHHHRCMPDGCDVSWATKQALATWRREPLFHLSSPLQGWSGPQPARHRDIIRIRDFPDAWKHLDCDVTLEVEAKAKEYAVLLLRRMLRARAIAC